MRCCGPEDRACLVLTSPDRYPNDQEQRQLYEFVYGGGTLVFAPNWDDPECEMRSLGIQTTERILSVSTTAMPAAMPAVPATPPGSAELPAEAAESEAPKKSASELEMDAIPPNSAQASSQSTDTPATDGSAENQISRPKKCLRRKHPA